MNFKKIVGSLALLATAMGFMGSACGPENPIRFTGQLTFNEDWGCGSAVPTQNVDWQTCHAFKHHINPTTGALLDDGTVNYYLPNTLRGLPATVELSVYGRDPESDAPGLAGIKLCSKRTFQTDLNGNFVKTMGGCGSPGSAYFALGRVYLSYTLRKGTKWGTIRGVWKEDQASEVFRNFRGTEFDEEPAFSRTETIDGEEQTVRYAIPAFSFYVSGTEPDTSGEEAPTEDLGTQVLLSSTSTGDTFGYMRQVLSAFSTMVTLHTKLRDDLGNPDSYYDNMFVNATDIPAAGWDHSYTIWFTDTWAYGWRGGISLHRPDLEKFTEEGGSANVMGLLSDTSVLMHEFGHSVHQAYAPVSFAADYRFANPLRRPGPGSDDDRNYDWGHNGVQYQELGVALTEGFASTIGQYLTNGCGLAISAFRPSGGTNPFAANMWVPDSSCDGADGCANHHVRYYLWALGISEGSTTWNNRVSALQAMINAGISAGHQFVTSNSETRMSELGCDILDNEPDVSHATGRVAGLRYLGDYTYYVAEILNGATLTSYPLRRFAWDPGNEEVNLSLPQFLEGMANFCETCTSPLPSAFGHDYHVKRLSVYAPYSNQSGQNFVHYLRDRGWIDSDTKASNLLRSNFMEDTFLFD